MWTAQSRLIWIIWKYRQLGIIENKCYFTTWWCRWLWNSSSKKVKCHEIHRAQVESAFEEVLLAFCRLYSCLYFRLVKEWIGDDDRLPFSNSLKQDIFRLIESWESGSPPVEVKGLVVSDWQKIKRATAFCGEESKKWGPFTMPFCVIYIIRQNCQSWGFRACKFYQVQSNLDANWLFFFKLLMDIL